MYTEFLVTKCLKICWKSYLTQRFPEYINVVVQSFFWGGGEGLNLLTLLCFVIRQTAFILAR